MNIMEKARNYLELEEHPVFCKEVEELIESNNIPELKDRFWRELDFGTGGLRGIIGGGDNRMNTYVIRKATKGLSDYILSHVNHDERSVVIACDSRHYSDVFAEEAARVLASNGIKTWLFDSLRPTPVLSFALRQLGACAGIMLTASHNPARYNGYKVFWSDGAQVVPPHDSGIIACVRKITGRVDAMDMVIARKAGLICDVDQQVDKAYSSMVVGQSLNRELMQQEGKNFHIVYSPLHGAGTVPIETVFQELGLSSTTVPEQREPDGDFPTVEFPNPEMAPALRMAIDLAKKKNADLVMATDPDADRLGIAIPGEDDWILLSGNQLGALLADYIFQTRKEQGSLPLNPAFVNTIVTSELQNRIAEFYGVTSFRVLTGFKYIGEKIREFEADNSYVYIFGGEESYGYLVGSSVRDKDAVSAAAMTGEMALWNRQRGMSVMAHLEEIWARFGYYEETLISHDFEGQRGVEIMAGLMQSLRENPPETVASIPLEALRDLKDGTTWESGSRTKTRNINLPSSNVLQCVLSDGSLVTVRPSGTEPKIKFYASCRSESGRNLAGARMEIQEKLSGIKNWINTLIQQWE